MKNQIIAFRSDPAFTVKPDNPIAFSVEWAGGDGWLVIKDCSFVNPPSSLRVTLLLPQELHGTVVFDGAGALIESEVVPGLGAVYDNGLFEFSAPAGRLLFETVFVDAGEGDNVTLGHVVVIPI